MVQAADFANSHHVSQLRRLDRVPVEKLIHAGEAFRMGSENVRAGAYTDADTGGSAGWQHRRMTDRRGR